MKRSKLEQSLKKLSKTLKPSGDRSDLNEYVRLAKSLRGEYDHVRKQIGEEQYQKIELQHQVKCIEEAQQIVQLVAEKVQQQAHSTMAGVVSRCLESVFDEPYEFRIEFERKRGKTEARLAFVRDGHEIDPLEGSGGGVVDIAAFALRLACIVLGKPYGRRVLVLDEPFRFVSNEYRPRVRALLETLATEMQMQFVIVTHIEELQTGTVIEVAK